MNNDEPSRQEPPQPLGAPAPRPADDETQVLRRALGDDTARIVGHRLAPQAMVEIYDVNGDLMGIVPVPAHGLSVGRGLDQDVRLDDRTVSRRHAKIVVEGDHYYLEDAGSRNDTLLNGAPVRGRALLHDGARITVGLHGLIVSIR